MLNNELDALLRSCEKAIQDLIWELKLSENISHYCDILTKLKKAIEDLPSDETNNNLMLVCSSCGSENVHSKVWLNHHTGQTAALFG